MDANVRPGRRQRLVHVGMAVSVPHLERKLLDVLVGTPANALRAALVGMDASVPHLERRLLDAPVGTPVNALRAALVGMDANVQLPGRLLGAPAVMPANVHLVADVVMVVNVLRLERRLLDVHVGMAASALHLENLVDAKRGKLGTECSCLMILFQNAT